ncbi:TIGR01777 family oxidoreductase [Ferruginibacter lapsinanis]|uniref:TIGR01777 family oxidoreductase n=1 Tax=Ferruginibacter lapsinanis TaxID=563172 RepID=UPI001E4B415D|nr:TIGR01777 family oxidoreductase [Ferruginibacter lapsinanis]UEG50278.1 TIGR01777 family oxidoreductase [Ferruginibacter lapsinanis]
MKTVLITGGTGLVGKTLTKFLLQKGYHVIILSRKKNPSANSDANIEFAQWNVDEQTVDIAAVQKADYIIHLAGAGVVDKKWTDSYKAEIRNSRTLSSKLLIDTLRDNTNKVKAVVSASAIGWYKPTDKLHTEDEPADESFLGETCKLWEESVLPFAALDKRLVTLRIGIVLSNDGGALVEFKKPIRLGIAAILGTGKQIVSWIHINDLCNLFINAIENEQWTGTYNAVAPTPVSNKELTLLLANKMKGKFFIPVHIPAFVLKIIMGNRSIEVLKSNEVSSTKVQRTGFEFLYPTCKEAVEDLCS